MIERMDQLDAALRDHIDSSERARAQDREAIDRLAQAVDKFASVIERHRPGMELATAFDKSLRKLVAAGSVALLAVIASGAVGWLPGTSRGVDADQVREIADAITPIVRDAVAPDEESDE